MPDSPSTDLTFKTKLLVLLGGLTLVSVLTVGTLSITSIIQTGRTAKEVGETTLSAQIQEFMIDLITTSADKTDLELDRVRQDVIYMKAFAEQVYTHPDQFPGARYWRARDRLVIGAEGRRYNRPGDISVVALDYWGA